MKTTLSNSNSDLKAIEARLDEIRMPSYERMLAKAHLARAEAVADLIVGVARFVKKSVAALFLRPIRRLAAAFG